MIYELISLLPMDHQQLYNDVLQRQDYEFINCDISTVQIIHV